MSQHGELDTRTLVKERDQLLLEREAFRRTILKHLLMIGYVGGERRSTTLGPNLDAADVRLSDDGELLRISLTDLLQRMIESHSTFSRVNAFRIEADHPLVKWVVSTRLLLKLIVRRHRVSKASFIERMQRTILADFDLEHSAAFSEWLAKRSVLWRLLGLSVFGRAKARGQVSRAAAGMLQFSQMARLRLLEIESLQSQEMIQNLQIELASQRSVE